MLLLVLLLFSYDFPSFHGCIEWVASLTSMTEVMLSLSASLQYSSNSNYPPEDILRNVRTTGMTIRMGVKRMMNDSFWIPCPWDAIKVLGGCDVLLFLLFPRIHFKQFMRFCGNFFFHFLSFRQFYLAIMKCAYFSKKKKRRTKSISS